MSIYDYFKIKVNHLFSKLKTKNMLLPYIWLFNKIVIYNYLNKNCVFYELKKNWLLLKHCTHSYN